MKKEWIQKIIVFVLFFAYFLIGISLYKDYGISTDEPDERESSFTNLKYALDTMGYDTLHGANGDLENYQYKYYGVAIQIPPTIVEWKTGFPGGAEMWQIRHAWTFGVCFVGYICFYLMCKEVFKSRWLSMLGTAMLALYPRFFAEQFYNIKDMIFAALVMISMYVTVRLIESKFSIFWTIVFSWVTALATNARIIGAIFPVLLLGYIWLTGILNRCKVETGEQLKHILRTSILTIVGYIGAYIVMMPILWKNPIKEIIAVFSKFSDYDAWNGTIVFLGKVIGGDEIPWYYIPVWLLVSLPVWYLLLFFVVAGVFVFILVKKIKKHEKIKISALFQNKYMLWAAMVGFLPWMATVVVQSTLYNGWRHFYFIMPPIVFMIVGGLHYMKKHLNVSSAVNKGILIVSVAGLLLQSGWIVKNHPYEMVYFNTIARNWGDCFDRDYWNLTAVELCKYILENDTSETITLNAPNDVFMRYLSEEEKARISLGEEDPMYHIYTYRGLIGNDYSIEGYEDYYTITVDGFKIATIYKKQS